MKSHNFKKTFSASMASLTVLSSLGSLSSVKVSAAPRASEPRINASKENEIEFTFGDMINFAAYYETTTTDIKKLVDYVPNLFNLLKVDKSIEKWKETMCVFFDTFAIITCGEQSDNLIVKDLEGLGGKYLPIGNTLNQIRKSLEADPSLETEISLKEVKEFMQNSLGMASSYTESPFKKLEKVVKVRNILYSAVEKLKQLHSINDIKNLREMINNSEEIRSEIKDPIIKDMVEATLNVLKAKEELATAESREFEAKNLIIEKTKGNALYSIQEHEEDINKQKVAEENRKAKKEAFSLAKESFEVVVTKSPGKILMEKLREFEKKEIKVKNRKKILETRPKSLREKIDYFENIAKTQGANASSITKKLQDTGKLKSDLKDMIKSADLSTFEEVSKTIEEMKANATELEAKEIINIATEALKAKENLLIAEVSTSMVNDVNKNIAAEIETLETYKDETEKWKKKYETAQEKQKDAQVKKEIAKANQESAEKEFLNALEQFNTNENPFTFKDLNELMKTEKSQEKFERKMAEICDFIDTEGNRALWYACLDEFEKGFYVLTEDFTDEEKAAVAKKLDTLPIAGILGKLRQLIMNGLPREEYLKAVSESLGIPMKIKPAETAKIETENLEQAETETLAENAQETKENAETPEEIKLEETAKIETENLEQAETETLAENAPETKENAEISEKIKLEETAKEKLELVANNSKQEKKERKAEKAKKKKSFWSFILDLLEKLPLLGRLIHFLRK